MEDYFVLDKRLGIKVPVIHVEWETLPPETQESILLTWEKIRGTIPDRIASLEKMINAKQTELTDEGDFERSCSLNSEIAELASMINDLWIWFRKKQYITEKIKH